MTKHAKACQSMPKHAKESKRKQKLIKFKKILKYEFPVVCMTIPEKS